MPTMTIEDDSVKGWSQPSFLPPAVLEITLKIGIMVDADHVQVQLEQRNATAGNLIAMLSWPHSSLGDAGTTIRNAGRQLTQMVSEATGPFTA